MVYIPLTPSLDSQEQAYLSEFEADPSYMWDPAKKKNRNNKKKSRDGSAVKNTGCSSGGPEFKSQQPHGGSQPSVMGSDALIWHAGVHADRALVHLKHSYINI